MSYIDGFVIAVPTANRQAFHDHARSFDPLFLEFGATRVVETWGDDVPDGTLTDFRRAVNATADETVVFSWVVWPSKEARKTAWEKIMADPRMQQDSNPMPFDGKRIIYGGFEPIVER